MRFLDRFLKPREAVQSLVVVGDPTGKFDKPQAKARGLRKGMWVKVPYQGVGILTELHPGGIAVVMLTDPAGLNLSQVLVNLNEPAAGGEPALRQAKFDEIPIPRRPHPDAAAALGY